MHSPVEPSSASARRFKKRYATSALLLVLLLASILPPFVTLNRYKPRLAGAIGAALGNRAAKVGDISLRLLPRPGLNVTGLEVADDPRFSAEPMLRAESVTAYLSLTSLWRGRLEISRLSLANPSLNLVRNAEGHWNLESVLEHAQSTPSAPTSNRAETRNRFPYIEAEDGRINFKFLQEKSVYVLTEADFSLWQGSENEWNMRLAARPARTDTTLTDTGTLKIDGVFQRTGPGQPTPFKLDLALERGQLGQLTSLLRGQDMGWRATVDADVSIVSSGADQRWSAQLKLADFRRYDVSATDALGGTVQCNGAHQPLAAMRWSGQCVFPVGNGRIVSTASLQELSRSAPWQGTFAAQSLPATFITALYRHVKKDVPSSLSAAGTLDAEFTRDLAGEWSAQGRLHNAVLRSDALKPDLLVGDADLILPPLTPAQVRVKVRPLRTLSVTLPPLRLSDDIASPSQTWVQANLSAEGYTLGLRGQAGAQRAIALLESLGIRTPDAEFTAALAGSLAINGNWSDPARPLLLGKLSVGGLKIDRSGALFPLRSEFSTLEFSEAGATFWTQDATLGSTGLRARGSLMFPRCNVSSGKTCPLVVDAHTDALHVGQLAQAFASGQKKSWYSFGRQQHTDNPLAELTLAGKISVGRLFLHTLQADQVTSSITVDHSRLSLDQFHAFPAGGKIDASIAADFSGASPTYSGSAKLAELPLEQLYAAFWSSGSAKHPVRGGAISGSLELAMSGSSAAELYDSSHGSADIVWKNGEILSNTEDAPVTLRVPRAEVVLDVKNAALHVRSGKIQSPNGIYSLQGAVSFAREYDLALEGNGAQRLSVKNVDRESQVAQRSRRKP